jgi:hypothetical protein
MERKAFEGLFPNPTRDSGRLEPSRARPFAFSRDLAIRGYDAARLGGLGCWRPPRQSETRGVGVTELPHPRVRKDSELDSGGLVIRTWRRNATPESTIVRHHAPSRRDHPSPRTLAGFVLQENQKDRRSVYLYLYSPAMETFFLDIRSGSCKYQSEYDPPMRLLLAQILDEFLGRRSGAQPCARVTMEDPPSTGSSSSRILQLNFTVPLTGHRSEAISRGRPRATPRDYLGYRHRPPLLRRFGKAPGTNLC